MARIQRIIVQKKGLNELDKNDGVVTHLERDILMCEVNWALGSITINMASGGDGIPAELLKILKDNAVKVPHSIMSANLENSGMATGLATANIHSNPNEGQCQRMFKLLYKLAHFTW